MPKIISQQLIDEIHCLTAEGLTTAAIAARVGVSQTSVARALAGQLAVQRGRQRPHKPKRQATLRIAPTRCPGCRGMIVELPCRLCTNRQNRKTGPLKNK